MSLKILDFPVKPHVRKYLNVQLGHGAYVLGTGNEYGILLYQLLRRQVKGKLHHAGSRDGCTQVLQLDMHNYPVHQYGLTELTDYTIYIFNDTVDEKLKKELYLWVRVFLNRQTTIREIILDFMAGYDLTDEDIQYETLRKAVQRNVDVKDLRKRKPKSVVKMSHKSAGLSQQTADLSQETGGLSRYASILAIRQQLISLPAFTM